MSKSSYNAADTSSPLASYDPNPPTVAAFAPASNSGYSATSKQRSTIIVHKKSPLLVATPPQITRALAHSHPFILILNKFVGLLSWSTGDPWQSFLLVAAFWAGCLYGGEIVRYATPLNAVAFLILGMWSRRYSPLSSQSRVDEKDKGRSEKSISSSSSSSPQHKSLDEIVGTLTQFTARCNILLEPFLTMTDFLSTQRTATSATTRPALTTLLIRIILVTPLWILLTLPPFYVLTARRTILATGTVILTWHSKPAKVSRVILWRSVLIRRLTKFTTGLDFDTHPSSVSSIHAGIASHTRINETLGLHQIRASDSLGVRFTFTLYENQRRWIGLGWTTSLFAYERAPWTDEHLNAASSKDDFQLPSGGASNTRWRWVEGSKWQIEPIVDTSKTKSMSSGRKISDTTSTSGSASANEKGWIYYDNKWNDGRAEDGWGRYTRRRKWFRDAELVEIGASPDNTSLSTSKNRSLSEDDENERVRKAKEYAKSLSPVLEQQGREKVDLADSVATIVPVEKQKSDKPKEDDIASVKSAATTATTAKRRSGWFGRTHSYNKSVDSNANASTPATDSGNNARSGGGRSSAVDKAPRTRDHSVSEASIRSASASVSKSDMSKLSARSRDGPENDVLDRWRDSSQSKNYGVGEDVYMSLG